MSSDVDYYVMIKRAGHYDPVMEQRLQQTLADETLIDEILTDEACSLNVRARYKMLRRAGQSRNMAAMLALGKAPAGIVR